MVTLLDGDLTAEWYTAAAQSTVIGCDIETSGLDRNKDRIATLQIYVPDTGVVWVRKLAAYPTYIIKLLERAKTQKVFHHAPFDLGFLIRDYPFLNPRRIADTKVAAKILDPRRTMFIDPIDKKGNHKLRTLVYHHFGYLMDKTIATSDWFADTLSDEQLEYGSKDVEYLPALLSELETALRSNGLLSIARKAYAILPQKVILDLKVDSDVYGY
jgi:ribonuclease D